MFGIAVHTVLFKVAESAFSGVYTTRKAFVGSKIRSGNEQVSKVLDYW